MTNQELYNAIFKRKSVRKYDMTPLSEEILDEIKSYVDNLMPLIDNIRYSISFLSEVDTKLLIPVKFAPHYICIYSEKKDGYLTNAGFLLQQIDLYLSARGIGSCWLGFFKPKKEVNTQNGLEFVILLAFGNPKESVHRKSISEFSRKSISEISLIKSAEKLLEPVRLAPSAINSQPWFFSGDLNEIIVSRQKLSKLKAPFVDRYNQIDIGIALYHLWLSLEHEGNAATFDFNCADAPEGYEFIVKVIAKEK
ncbi:nitroreductase [Ruminiclostridium herbifermentans]|uniref:Nitroreductase n=1 Tax=Ruminiclostridium herbifermentans TaxID=2488810 RepID=A0A4U7JK86_9FIRM|nr:nitroreductase family protein [Ruminiclostridium herbifermentans]QNU65376.1 nitroreductase [Ruminiclostridium herbifermentans]